MINRLLELVVGFIVSQMFFSLQRRGEPIAKQTRRRDQARRHRKSVVTWRVVLGMVTPGGISA
jgi:hypothetical protein